MDDRVARRGSSKTRYVVQILIIICYFIIANIANRAYNMAMLASLWEGIMSSATIAQTRDGFSGIIQSLVSGEAMEHLVLYRNRPVARIVPVEISRDVSRRIGVMKDRWDDFDYDEFQALDDEVADAMGV